MATEGFFVPGSRTADYVKSKPNEYGASDYYSNVNELGIQKQAALQNLSDQYASTINNAYAAYLANQRNIMTSAMGQGFKEQYLQNQQQQLAAQQAQAAQNLATSRAQLEQQSSANKQTIDELYTKQTKNLDRIVNSMGDYLTYVKSLTGVSADKQTELKALTEEQEQMSLDELYGTLYNLDPKNLVDEEGIQGKRYSDWIKSQIKGTDEDTDWYNWLMYEGGLQDYKAMLDKTEAVQRPLKEKQIAENKLEYGIESQYEIDKKQQGSNNNYVGSAIQDKINNTTVYSVGDKAYVYNLAAGAGEQTRDFSIRSRIARDNFSFDIRKAINDKTLAVGDIIKSTSGGLYIIRDNDTITSLLEIPKEDIDKYSKLSNKEKTRYLESDTK